MEAETPRAEEGYELVPDGTIRFWTDDGRTWKLRRPRLGEVRKMRERLEGVQDAAYDLRSEVEAILAQTKATAPDDPAIKANLRSSEERLRASTAKVQELNLAWITEAFDLLGDKPLPPADELPGWMLDPAKMTGEFMAHWRNRPLALGGS